MNSGPPNILLTGKVEVVKAGGKLRSNSALETQRKQCFKMAMVGCIRSSEKPNMRKTDWNSGFG